MSTAVELIAVGARTPVGLVAETTAAAVRAGISRLREIPFATVSGEPLVAALDSKLDPLPRGRDRMLPLADSALEEVVRKLGGAATFPSCEVLLALPEVRPGFSSADAEWLVAAVGARLRALSIQARVAIGGRGHAGVVAAIVQAQQAVTIRPDIPQLVLGVDSHHHPLTYLWLEDQRRLAQPAVRGGMVPGEGSGCLVLTSTRARRAMRAPVLAVLAGAHTAQETRLRQSETGSLGHALADAVLGALAGASLPSEAVDTTYSDINGERYRSEEWGLFAMRASAALRSLDYEAPSNCWGDVGAAFGALATVIAAQSFARRYARGPRALVMAGSEGGLRGAVLWHEPGNP